MSLKILFVFISFNLAVAIVISGFLLFRNIRRERKSEKQIALLKKQNTIECIRNKMAGDVYYNMGASLTRMGLYSQQLLQEKNLSEKERQLLEKIYLQSKEVI